MKELSKEHKRRIKDEVLEQMDYIEDKVNEGLSDILEPIIERENINRIDAWAYARKIFFKG